MKLTEISFRPIALVTFSDVELDLLGECAAKHYDSACAATIHPGGFLYGMRNRAVPGSHHSLTFREVDTLAKIIEVGAFFPNLEKKSVAFGLGLELRRTLLALNTATPAPVTGPS